MKEHDNFLVKKCALHAMIDIMDANNVMTESFIELKVIGLLMDIVEMNDESLKLHAFRILHIIARQHTPVLFQSILIFSISW